MASRLTFAGSQMATREHITRRGSVVQLCAIVLASLPCICVAQVPDFEKAIRNGLSQGGAPLVLKLGNDLRFTVHELDANLNDQKDSVINSLSAAERSALLELSTLRHTLSDSIRGITAFGELSLIDVNGMLPHFLNTKDAAYVNSVDGLTVSKQDNEYRLIVRGLGLGFDDVNTPLNTDVYVNGHALPNNCLRVERKHELLVAIPAALIGGLFQASATVAIPLELRYSKNQIMQEVAEERIVCVRKCGLFRHTCICTTINKPMPEIAVKAHSVQFSMRLLPTAPGTISIEEIIDDGYNPAPTTKEHEIWAFIYEETAIYKEEWAAPPHHIIEGVKYDVLPSEAGNPGGLSYNLRRIKGSTEYGPDFEIVDNKTRVFVFRKVSGASFKHTVTYRELLPRKSTVTRTYVLSYGSPLVVSLNAKNADGNYRVSGTLITGEKIEFNRDTAKDATPLRLIGSGIVAGVPQVTFTLYP